MEKLKVGDKVCQKYKSRFGKNFNYRFSTVVRLTKTQAVLDNGKKLVNEAGKDFVEVGNRFSSWEITTPEILHVWEKEKQRQAIVNWFDSQEFTDEQKKQVYELFNNK